MKVAVIAPGEVGRYIVEALVQHGHQTIAVSRGRKQWLESLGVDQHTTDYSVSNLTEVLYDCDAAVCTLRGSIPEYVNVHKAILAACTASPTCKRFIPSTWTGNIEEFPDEPLDWAEDLQQLFSSLRSQQNVKWTAMCPGWFADYTLALSQRHFGDAGESWPQNLQTKVFTMYGKGKQVVSLTSARDAASATVAMLEQDASTWEEYTYVSGEQISWSGLFDFLKSKDSGYTFRIKSLAESIREYMLNPGQLSNATFQIWGHSDAMNFSWDKVLRHRQMYFANIRFRTLAELFDDAKLSPGKTV